MSNVETNAAVANNEEVAVEVTKTVQFKLTSSAVITDLTNGLNRKEIAAKYGVPKAQIDKIFKNPALKGLRPKGKAAFEFVVDTDPVAVIAKKEKKAPVTESEAPAATTEEGDVQVSAGI